MSSAGKPWKTDERKRRNRCQHQQAPVGDEELTQGIEARVCESIAPGVVRSDDVVSGLTQLLDRVRVGRAYGRPESPGVEQEERGESHERTPSEAGQSA